MSIFYRSILLSGVLVCMISCELNFDPFEENEEFYYSIQGVLDASKEVQNVRISPVRQSFHQPSDPIDVVVTLEHVESGDVVVMEDSLLQYAEDAWAWNFYTDMPILHGDNYQLTATRSDGKFSRATVEIPQAIPEPVITCHCETHPQDHLGTIDIFLEGVDKLAVAEALYYYTARERIDINGNVTVQAIPDRRPLTMSLLDNHLTPPEAGGLRVWVTVQRDIADLAETLGYQSYSPFYLFIEDLINVELVSAGPEWPETEGRTDEEQSLAVEESNVENGVGNLAGIVSMEDIRLNFNYPCPPAGNPVCGFRESTLD